MKGQVDSTNVDAVMSTEKKRIEKLIDRVHSEMIKVAEECVQGDVKDFIQHKVVYAGLRGQRMVLEAQMHDVNCIHSNVLKLIEVEKKADK